MLVDWAGCGVCELLILGGWFWWWRGFYAGFSFCLEGIVGICLGFIGLLDFPFNVLLGYAENIFSGFWWETDFFQDFGSGGLFCEGKLAPEAGLEPATRWLTASCSTIELLWKLKVEGNFNQDRDRRQDCFVDFLAWLAVRAEKGASRSLNDSLNFFRTANAVFSFSTIHAPRFFGGFCSSFSSKVEEAIGAFLSGRKGLAARSRRAQWLGTR